jgi:ubiquinone/menaquinone biosynthesis C-methylase UbiE
VTDLNDLKKISDFWGVQRPPSAVDLYSFPPIRSYFYNLVTNEVGSLPGDDWLERWFRDKYFQAHFPVDSCLSLCCGHGERDRRLNDLKIFKKCYGIDVSKAAIENAKKQACAEGIKNIEYETADLNSCSLGNNLYDLIYIAGGAHHISNLENLFSEAYKSLKKGGILFCDEYIGPNYSNLSSRHLEIINSIIHMIPERLKIYRESNFIPTSYKYKRFKLFLFLIRNFSKLDFSSVLERNNIGSNFFYKNIARLNKILLRTTTNKNFIFGKVFDISPENIKKVDPSEGVRSSEIISVMKNYFKNVEVHPYNGGIMAYALDRNFFVNFDANNAEDSKLLGLIIAIEKYFTDTGEVPVIHAAIVARK